jgi:hypothetical protein
MSTLAANTIQAASGEIVKMNDALAMTADTAKIYERSALFTWASATTITVQSFTYFHNGTLKQYVYSNASISWSPSVSGTQWYYVYLDDSAIVTAATNVITSTQLLASTTAPTWSDAKQGWYSGSDRCIFAFLSASAVIEEFWQEGDFVLFPTETTEMSAQTSTFPVDVTLTMPGFSTGAMVSLVGRHGTDVPDIFWEPKGNAGTGSIAVKLDATVVQHNTIFRVITDTSQRITLRATTSGTGGQNLYQSGWFLPIGM